MRVVFLFLIQGIVGFGITFWVFWLLLGFVHLGGISFCHFTPLCVQSLGLKDVPFTGHALWAEVGGGIIFVTPGEFAGKHKILPVVEIMRFGVFCFSSCIC